MDLGAVLLYLRPGAEWTFNDDSYESLIWHSHDIDMPTLGECQKAWGSIQRDYRMRPIRERRNALLAASDWTQAADAPVDAKAWAAYRQALRDLPATVKDPTQPVDWPTPPE